MALLPDSRFMSLEQKHSHSPQEPMMTVILLQATVLAS